MTMRLETERKVRRWREQRWLLDQVIQTRGIDWEAYDRSIDILVSRLRQKLGDDPRQPSFIRTIRGVGYSFVGGGNE